MSSIRYIHMYLICMHIIYYLLLFINSCKWKFAALAWWKIALEKSEFGKWTLHFLLLLPSSASFSRFWVSFFRAEDRERERELESGKRHWHRVRLNYEKRLCILSPALPQTFASIMHTPTQSACGTQLQCIQGEEARKWERDGERELSWAERLQQGLLLFAGRAQFTAWQIRRISCGFQAFRLVGCLAWVTCNFDCQLRRLEDGARAEVGWATWPQQHWSNWIYCKWQKDLSSGWTEQPNRLQLWGIISFFFFHRFWFWFVFRKTVVFRGWVNR